MSTQIALMLGTVVAAVALFSWDRISADVASLAILLFLVLARLLPPERAFAGFGSEVVVMMLGLLILMAALTRTGVTDSAARFLLRSTDSSPTHILIVTLVAAVAMGAFMSNTAATALFLPIVVAVAHRSHISVGKLLMPLAFASILASSITLVSTSTNLVVSGLMADYGLSPMGMFELTPVGLPIAVMGLLYLFTVGRRLVPDRIPTEQTEALSVRLYLSEVLIPARSSLIGKTLEDSGMGRDLNLTVLRITRGNAGEILPGAHTRLASGDVLLVEGERQNILRIKQMASIDIRAEVELSTPDLEPADIGLTEVILAPGSPMIGRTLKGLQFRQQCGLQVLAINRHGARLRDKLSQIRLRLGDVLVVQGNRVQIAALDRGNTFRILGAIDEEPRNRERAPIAVAIFGGVLVLVALNVLPLPVATLVGALAVFVTRCITPEEAYSRVNWKALIVIASMLAFGAAMEATGTAELVAQQAARLAGHSQPIWLLSAFFALTLFLTQPMSNQAAAVVVLPIAMRTATQLGLNPRAFAMVIALAASCSFLTPLEPSCLLVYGPGRYRFLDFAKVGLVPTLLVYLISIIMVPVLWPLQVVP